VVKIGAAAEGMNRTEAESYQEFGSLPARLFGVLRSPRRLFRHVIDHPRYADVMAISVAVTFICGVALMQTEVGRLALVDQWERTAEAFGRPVDDAQYAQLQEASRHALWYAAASALASGPVVAAGLAALIFAVFTGALGGRASYTQVLAVTAHAGVILALRQLVSTPLSYTRETLASPATLTMFFPMFEETSPAARFFGIVDLFVVWWVVALATGVSHLYVRPIRKTTAVFLAAYVGVAMLVAMIMVMKRGTA
jgi:hypothetical protein